MGLFSRKKEKKRCPICGDEMGFFSGTLIKDGFICEKCESMVRGQFRITEYVRQKWGTDGMQRSDYRTIQDDPLDEMTIAEIREMIAVKKEQNDLLTSEMGAEFANLARVESFFTIAPKPLQVGLKRARELNNRIVATSLVISGEISRGDIVTVKTGETVTETKVLDVHECSSSSTFETVLSANMGKHKATAGTSAWIFLDMTEGVEEGTIIGF